MKKKILVVDNEPSIVALLQYNLENAGFEVITTMDGEKGKSLAKTESPDMIILDITLPYIDGLEICKQLRQDKIMTPILMLAAKGDELDKVLGLDFGADDYMVKPFSPREVIARINAVLRRARTQMEPGRNTVKEEVEINIGKLKIYPEKHEAYFEENLLDLSLKEFEILRYLAENKGRVLTRDQLLNAVWKYDFYGQSRIVDVHISRLRDKMNEVPKNPAYIKTLRGLGYKLEEPRQSRIVQRTAIYKN
jgi:two-component system alkaline phosphatase synthesis response regulator PhoP